MAAKILYGKEIAAKKKEKLKKTVSELKKVKKAPPKLVALCAGEYQTTRLYVKTQKKVAEELGIIFAQRTLDKEAPEEDFLKEIDALNKDESVTGIIISLPLPKHISYRKAVNYLDYKKDVEGVHPMNLGRVLLGDYTIAPCTACACMELIRTTGVDIYGKEAIVIGHSEIVGKPLSMMLLKEFATISICHIATDQRGQVSEHVKRAEILVVAVGKPQFIKGDWMKEGVIVVDVGINKAGDKIVGDVDFESAKKKASFITPVPGGVGPLTTTMLMRNLIEVHKRK
jgi:methylenetetrahydrofolate dehydrogenase (NADP+)/methenyltetrahydrofolate cyclohydrolase